MQVLRLTRLKKPSLPFILPIKRTLSLYLADFFIILAAVMTLLSSVLAFKKSRYGDIARSRFFGWPIMRVGVIGLTLSILVNFVFIVLAQFVYVLPWLVIILNLCLLVIVGNGLLVVDSSRNFVEEQEVRRDAQTKTMKELRLRSKQLLDMCRAPELQERLKNMAGAFRYSDPNSSMDSEYIENQIQSEMDLLEVIINTDIDQSIIHIDKIEELLKKRNGRVLSGK